ncbi:MAG: DNA gyrase inhibitor YacG [Gammaproteobacteria bacterium AqS3]|nr:DNA gyrase inhibitor YacG [Gammaproteobacteria bacterium AqS3]
MSAERLIDCPACGAKVLWSPENRWRPFCSERCKLVDLGKWANEEYAIEGDPVDPDRTPVPLRPEELSD